MNKISLIICAYNEEKNIQNIIRNVHNIPTVSEIIIVNDGSQDKTKDKIISLKSELNFIDIHLPENMGKGYAIATGVESSTNEYLVFIDADLSNVRAGHLNQLIDPVIQREADMVLGQASDTLINYHINPFKSFSGQRALIKNDVIPILDRIKPSRYGVETILNLYYQANNKKVKQVILHKLKHPSKFDKAYSYVAIKEFFIEGHEIISTTFNNMDLVKRSLRNKIHNQLNISA